MTSIRRTAKKGVKGHLTVKGARKTAKGARKTAKAARKGVKGWAAYKLLAKAAPKRPLAVLGGLAGAVVAMKALRRSSASSSTSSYAPPVAPAGPVAVPNGTTAAAERADVNEGTPPSDVVEHAARESETGS